MEIEKHTRKLMNLVMWLGALTPWLKPPSCDELKMVKISMLSRKNSASRILEVAPVEDGQDINALKKEQCKPNTGSRTTVTLRKRRSPIVYFDLVNTKKRSRAGNEKSRYLLRKYLNSVIGCVADKSGSKVLLTVPYPVILKNAVSYDPDPIDVPVRRYLTEVPRVSFCLFWAPSYMKYSTQRAGVCRWSLDINVAGWWIKNKVPMYPALPLATPSA
ncbi:hypothetical protein BX600DRAFT_441881 [Xylariales sp. PMI_506]|nr:hypothetical protein BX600DRAFT_441881 [Xylariales sp. PMI_506]